MSGSIGPDDGFERLLRGEAPETPEEHAFGLFLQDVRGAFPAEPPLSGEVHVAAIVQAAQLLADKGEPAARPASKADGRGRHVSGLPKRRRVIVKVRVMRSLAAKVVAGAVVLMSMFGGLAFAGALPGQDSDDNATDVVEVQDVGSEEPAADEAEDADDVEDEAEGADDQAEDADDQGEDADDQGEDTDEADDVESEDADDEGEDADDQGEDESEDESEDQGEDDDESEDADEGAEDESEDADESGEED